MIKLSFLVACIACAACVACAAQDARESRVVQTAQGPVKGYKTDDIFEFYGIPYASAPLPGPMWMNTLEAVNKNLLCPQQLIMMRVDLSEYQIQEDCLVVNVYVPDTEETNLPVVVYVHGGAYQFGFGAMASPSALVQTKKVIAVTFNYRLGVHGFLCLGTEKAPGNAGMKDQVALLQWVQKNIANFGGNPKEVTIAGFSAGSSSVDLLMLSEMTKGLYSKVIPESGASVGVWSVQLDPVQNAKDYAKQLNFTKVDDINSLEEFYTTTSFEALTSDSFMWRPDSTFVFSPCLERDTGVERFLIDSPVDILRQGKYRKVAILYGFAEMEGIFRLPVFEQWKDAMNEKFSDFLPIDLQFNNDKEKERVAQETKEFYFGDKPVSLQTVQAYVDYFSDVLFAYPTLRSVKLQVEAGSDSIYLYQYSYLNPIPEAPNTPEYITKVKGADHCAQTFSILKSDFINSGPNTDEYKKVKKTMVELWVNFITTGKPAPEGSDLPSWLPVGANRSPYADLGKGIQVNGPLLEKRALFWDDIYEKYYKTPVAPSVPRVKTEL